MDLRFERLAEHATADLAYILEIERIRLRIAGSDEFASVALRVTSVFRREEDGWRVDSAGRGLMIASNTYGHVLEQRQRQVARAMDAVLGG